MKELPKQFKLYPKWMAKLAKGYRGTTLWPFGIYLARFDYYDMDILINHELIHWKQQKEMGGLFFYLWYGLEYIIRRWLIKNKFVSLKQWLKGNNHNTTYRNLSFEREAYTNEKKLTYLSKRKNYKWMSYLIKDPLS